LLVDDADADVDVDVDDDDINIAQCLLRMRG